MLKELSPYGWHVGAYPYPFHRCTNVLLQTERDYHCRHKGIQFLQQPTTLRACAITRGCFGHQPSLHSSSFNRQTTAIRPNFPFVARVYKQVCKWKWTCNIVHCQQEATPLAGERRLKRSIVKKNNSLAHFIIFLMPFSSHTQPIWACFCLKEGQFLPVNREFFFPSVAKFFLKRGHLIVVFSPVLL